MRVLEFKVSRLSPAARLGFGRSGFTRYRANHTGNSRANARLAKTPPWTQYGFRNQRRSLYTSVRHDKVWGG